MGENLVTWRPDVFIRSQKEWGGHQGGKSWLENCFGDSVGFFGLASLCTLTRVIHVCHDTPPQHHENHGVSLKRDMKVKKKKMSSAERLFKEGMRARKQMVILSSLCTVHP